jgi:hypothetical protein
MVRAHAHLAMMQLRSGADALPGRPVRSGTPTGLYQGEEVFAGFSAVAALTLLSAGESDPEPDLVRAMRVIAAQPLHVSLISGANAQRSRRTVLLTIAGRWRDVHPEGRLMFEVESWRHPDPRTLVAAAHELRVLVSAWRDLSAMEIHKTFNVGLVSYHWFDEYVTHPWAARCGRSGALLLSAELIARGATTAECADAWQRSYAAGRNRWAMLRDPVGHALTFGPIPLMHVIRLQETKNQIFAALLVALIRGEPIPVDPTDPAGKPLRRYERNGELIGYYACGDDGVDDGGTTDDWRFPFDRPWDPPASP